MKISYAKTVYGKKEIQAVVNCLKKSTQMGANTQKFEKKISILFDKKETLFVNSGSSALFLAIEACSFKEKSEVITPALTFGTTVSCLLKNKLTPVFIDIEKDTYCIDVEKIEDSITKKTVAILAPNLLGNICDWHKIRKIANKHNLIVIEDSADTLGAYLNRNKTGYYTDISVTSFYGSHIINCAGNGGAVCFNNYKFLKKAKLLRSWGRSSSLFDERSEAIENRFNIKLGNIDYDAKFVFQEPGYNFEGSEIGAAFGLEQLKDLKQNIKVRENNFKIQKDFFSNWKKFFYTPIQKNNVKTAWLAFPIRIKENAPFNRKELQIYLEKKGIQTRVVFTGNIVKQPMMKNQKYRISKKGLVNTDQVMENGMLLPVHHGMTKEMFEKLHSEINNFLSKYL